MEKPARDGHGGARPVRSGGRVADQCAEAGEGLGAGPVVDPHAPLVPVQQPGLVQHLQVMADRGLGQVEGVVEVADAGLAARVGGIAPPAEWRPAAGPFPRAADLCAVRSAQVAGRTSADRAGSVGSRGARPTMRSAARSAMAMVGALVLPRGTTGITEASTTRSRSSPRTRSSGSTTLVSLLAASRESPPIAQVPTGWKSVPRSFRMNSRTAASDRTSGPGDSSDLQILASGPAQANSRAIRTPSTSGSMSVPSDR